MGKAIKVVIVVWWLLYYMQNIFLLWNGGIDELCLKVVWIFNNPCVFLISPSVLCDLFGEKLKNLKPGKNVVYSFYTFK